MVTRRDFFEEHKKILQLIKKKYQYIFSSFFSQN